MKIGILILFLLGVTASAQMLIPQFFSKPPVSVSYLFKESLEAPGFENSGWLTNSTAVSAFTPAIDGSYSLKLPSACNATNSFASNGTIYAFFMIEGLATNGNGASICSLLDSADATMAVVKLTSADVFRLELGTGVNNSSVSMATTGSVYYVWLDYQQGTGANAVGHLYVATTSTKPGSASATVSNGSTTGQASKIKLATGSGIQMVYDKIRVSLSNIGSSPP